MYYGTNLVQHALSKHICKFLKFRALYIYIIIGYKLYIYYNQLICTFQKKKYLRKHLLTNNYWCMTVVYVPLCCKYY